MIIFVKAMGLLIACLSSIFIYCPQVGRAAIGFCREGIRLYVAAALRVVIGVLLIAASFSCGIPKVVLAIGIVAAVAGAVAIGLGLRRMRGVVDYVAARPDNALRLLGTIALLFGVALVFAA